MKLNRVGVGFIGTGRISDLHAIEYLNNPHAEIVALCDRNPALAEERARVWGLSSVRIYEDHQELLSRNEIDLVEILVPHHVHKPVAMAALAAGKAVSLQKPMCLTVGDADDLIDAAAQASVPFKVFENFVFYPPVSRAKALIDEGAVGELLSIRIKSNPGKSATAWTVPASAAAWRQQRDQAGGGPLVFDDGHHKFALAWHFMGQAEEVHAWIGATTAPDGFVFDAPAIVSFKFPNQRYGNLEVVYSPELEIATRHYAQDDRMEITGSRGVIWINRGHGALGEPVPVVLYRDGQTVEFNDMETGWESSFVYSTRHFIEALRDDRPPKLTGEEGRDILRFALAAERSASLGKAVSV